MVKFGLATLILGTATVIVVYWIRAMGSRAMSSKFEDILAKCMFIGLCIAALGVICVAVGAVKRLL